MDPFNQQSHPVEIFVEEDLARLVNDKELRAGEADWWLDTGTERRGIRFNNPFMRMQWDLVNLRLRDKKEKPIRLGTKLDSQFETQSQETQDDMNFGEVLNLVAPMLDRISYGSGSMYAAAMPQFSEVADNMQRIHQYAKRREEIANRNAHEAYIQRINDVFMEDGFAVVPIHADGTDMMLEKPDYTVEEVWRGGLSGPIAESVRIFSGEGQLLYKMPYHRSQVAVSIFLRAKMAKGELDLKSEKYTILSDALNLWEGEQYDDALQEFEKAFEADPRFVNGYRFRAKFFMARGQWEKAIQDLSEAIKWLRVRERAPLYYDRGRLYWEMDQIKESLSDFDRILRTNPREISPLTNRGFCWLEKQKWRKASADFDAVLAQDPQNVMALTGNAWAAAMQGRYDEALQQFNRVLEMIPDLLTARRGRGYCYMKLGQKDAAQADLVRVLREASKGQSPMMQKKRAEIQRWLKGMESEVSLPEASGGV
ncbi:MAG: tetratricopeptide repeat protein [Candidatus Omnitrophica bacterium]|nr:tetratricopeptide repeat protein [Candidatus Omnitrophota bacterium]